MSTSVTRPCPRTRPATSRWLKFLLLCTIYTTFFAPCLLAGISLWKLLAETCFAIAIVARLCRFLRIVLRATPTVKRLFLWHVLATLGEPDAQGQQEDTHSINNSGESTEASHRIQPSLQLGRALGTDPSTQPHAANRGRKITEYALGANYYRMIWVR